MFTAVVLLFTTNVASANPISEGPNISVKSLDGILHLEYGFAVSSAAWSPDGVPMGADCFFATSPQIYP
jgi:hypothetical protein